ncbi:MAG TPA: hypothetical protein VEK38_02065, partial [Candidatus Bathyarchaeia archaeon]|nr:hypothetical protein [Candidatus Bathyarchaeia archaeon]
MYICVFVISLMVVPVIDAKFSLKNITDSVSTKINRVGATFNRGVNGMTRKTGVWGSHSYIGFKTINNLFQRSSGEMQLLMIKIITDHLHMMVDGYPEIETDDPKILEKKQYDVQNALMFIELPVTEKEKLYAFTCQDNAVKSFIASVAGKEFLQLLYKAVPVYKPCKYVGALVKHDEKEHLMFLDQEIEGINASLEKIGQEKYQYDLRQKEYEEKRGPIQISMEIIDNRYRELAEQCAIIEEDIILKDVEKE